MIFVWTTILTGGFIILSVFVTSRLNERAESKRRSFELGRHKLDQAHDHKERLLDVRLTIYQEFYVSFAAYRRTHNALGQAWRDRVFWTSQIGTSDSIVTDHINRMFDEADKRMQDALSELVVATEVILQVLEKTALVATGNVLNEAVKLRFLSEQAWDTMRNTVVAAGINMDAEMWSQWIGSEQKVVDGRYRLTQAIRAELGVETDSPSAGGVS